MGDWVFLKLRPYRQHTLASRHCEKLALRFYGPYKVLEKIGAVAYKLKLPTDPMVHNVFHVSQLKRFVGTSVQVQTQAPNLTDEFELHMIPEKVLGVR